MADSHEYIFIDQDEMMRTLMLMLMHMLMLSNLLHLEIKLLEIGYFTVHGLFHTCQVFDQNSVYIVFPYKLM